MPASCFWRMLQCIDGPLVTAPTHFVDLNAWTFEEISKCVGLVGVWSEMSALRRCGDVLSAVFVELENHVG